MRNDVQAAPGGIFLSFDGILASTSSSMTQPTAYERHSSLDTLTQATASQLSLAREDVKSSSHTGKKRWGLFKTIMPFSGFPDDRSKSHAATLTSRPLTGNEPATQNELTTAKTTPSYPSFRPYSFKFSLEWADRDIDPAGKERPLYPPRLPLPAQTILQSVQVHNSSFEPTKPEGSAIQSSKYAGRALAEWAILILECQTFFERRKNEGVPSNEQVETPTLGVETFRR